MTTELEPEDRPPEPREHAHELPAGDGAAGPHPLMRPLQVRVRVPTAGAARAAVVLVHGFKSFMHWGFLPELARRLARAGLVAVTYNASHNGVSARLGEPEAHFEVIDDDEAFRRNTHALELRDLALVRRWVRSGGAGDVDPTRIGLFGHSRGGGIAVLSAAREPAAALVAFAPIDDIDRVDDATKARWRAAGELCVPNARTGQVHRLGLDILDEIERREPALDIRAAATRVACPALIVHGTADDSVPFRAAETLAARLPRVELLRIEGGNHTFGGTHPLGSPLHPHLERALTASVEHFTRHLGD